MREAKLGIARPFEDVTEQAVQAGEISNLAASGIFFVISVCSALLHEERL